MRTPMRTPMKSPLRVVQPQVVVDSDSVNTLSVVIPDITTSESQTGGMSDYNKIAKLFA
jgi:hypothetical protein